MKQLPLLIFGILVILGSIALFAANKQVGIVEPKQQGQAEQKNLPSIGIDLSAITPQFVDDRESDPENPVPLPDDLKKVKKAVVDMYVERNKILQPTSGYGEKEFESQSREFNSRLTLLALDKRYVLVALPGPRGYSNVLIDTANGTELFAGVHHTFKTKDALVYILSDKISYYKLGQSSFLTVANSELAPTETYHGGDQDFALSPKATHMDTTLNISVFDGSKYISSPEDPNIDIGFKKLRDITLALP